MGGAAEHSRYVNQINESQSLSTAHVTAFSPPDKLLGWSDNTFEIRSLITGEIEGIFRQKKAKKVGLHIHTSFTFTCM